VIHLPPHYRIILILNIHLLTIQGTNNG
jgi:hypothetical protein